MAHEFESVEKELPDNGVYLIFAKGAEIVKVGANKEKGEGALAKELRKAFFNNKSGLNQLHKKIALDLNGGYSMAAIFEYWRYALTKRNSSGIIWDRDAVLKMRELERKIVLQIRETYSFSVLALSDDEGRLALESTIKSLAGCTASSHSRPI